jgi:hypothetical protein
MDTDREDDIRRRAHDLWVKEGSPEGRHLDHWDEATRQIDAEVAGGSAPSSDEENLETGLEDSFPASDPPAQAAPKKRATSAAKRATAKRKSPLSDPGSPGGTGGTGGTARDQDR